MLHVVTRRLLATVPTALLGSVLIFSLVQLIPGGAAETLAGAEASPETIAAIRAQLGLDRPLHVQYLSWLGRALHGDFGHSLLDNRNIGEAILDRLPLTAELATMALLIALLVGIPLGIAAAVRRNTTTDAAITSLSGLGLALPEFWLAMLAVNLFALRLAWLPATGVEPLEDGLWPHIASLLMPAATLASGAAAAVTRFTRSGMIDALNAPYTRTAWALGLPARQIFCRFALRNAIIPVITITGVLAGALLGGAVLVEQVFVIPGLGDMLVTGVLQKDYPSVQSVALVLTFAIISINLAVDLLCAIVDPRSR